MKKLLLILVLILSSCSLGTFYKNDKKDKPVKPIAIDRASLYPEIPGMKLIEGASFIMGSRYKKDELPLHKVFLSDYYLDENEVTVREFRAFTRATKRKFPKQPSWNRDDHPVVNVTWEDAMAYARWQGKRLPSEAEWEYAARGGKRHYTFTYQSEQRYGKNYENIADESMRREKPGFPVVDGYDDGYVYTSPVGIFPPNSLGIHDLNGNVLEWCSDWYDADYSKIKTTKDPVGVEKGFYKVIRGASWNRRGNYMRAAYRTFYNPKVRFKFLGFRCAKDARLPITQNNTGPVK